MDAFRSPFRAAAINARVHGLSKDSCQFVCAKDADGLAVRTLDGADFLAVNGVQTLSHKYCNLIGDLDMLAKAGVTSLRLSPHTGDFNRRDPGLFRSRFRRPFGERGIRAFAAVGAGSGVLRWLFCSAIAAQRP